MRLGADGNVAAILPEFGDEPQLAKDLTNRSIEPQRWPRGQRLVDPVKGKAVRLERHRGSPQLGDHAEVRRWLERQPRPWAIDLFCGAGGLSLGLQEAGFSIVASADFDDAALESHAHNVGGLVWNGDLSDPSEFLGQLKSWGIEQADLVAGGPPCQPFSRAGASKIRSLVQAGKRPASDPRANLWRSFFKIVDTLEPKGVLLENVPEFTSAGEGSILLEFLDELNRRGYQPYTDVLEAWRYGVPQHRRRLFVVALRQGMKFKWPKLQSDRCTLGDAIEDLPRVEAGQHMETLKYERPENATAITKWFRDGLHGDECEVVHDHITRGVRPDDAEIFAMLEPTQKYSDVPSHLQRYRADIFDDRYYRLSMKDLSRSITAHLAKDGYGFIHPEIDRTISVREAARIQTFPDRFRFAGHPTTRFRQIGNAVPPLLARSIGQAMAESFSAQKQVSPEEPADRRGALEGWHKAIDRKLPWRELHKPWQILLAEICLRRTKAEQVASVYSKLIESAATPADLVAKWPEVSKSLYHLGLKWRSANLLELANTLGEKFGGKVPATRSELISLPGVGDYVALATLCFGFGKPAVLIDSNTRRLVRRWLGDASISTWQMRLRLYEASQPKGPDEHWNYMLLDLAGLVCTPRKPSCGICPLRASCATGSAIEAPSQMNGREVI